MINRDRWKDELRERLTPERKTPIDIQFGVLVEEGWKTLICDLIDRLDELCSFKILQVKEKFGALRFYVECEETPPPGFREAVKKAEKDSATICEDCGAPAELRGDSWVRTLCVPCNEKFLAKRLARWREGKW